MSVPTKIQSSATVILLSTDNITYKSVLCKRAWNFNGTTSVNAEEDDCGISKGLGAPDWTMDFEGSVNTAPDSATEISAKTLLDYWQNKTLLYIKTMTGDGTGSNLYIQGQGYVTDLTVSAPQGGIVGFNFTFNGEGTVDTTV